jgi:type IV pilus assembly protein PilE
MKKSRFQRPGGGALPGYTLLELMLVVALMGILAGLSIPNFRAYTAKGKRNTAYSVLNSVAAAQGAYYSDALTYATTFTAMNLSPALGTIDSGDATKFYAGNYEFVLTLVNSNKGYMVTATGDVDGDSFLDVIVLRSNTP